VEKPKSRKLSVKLTLENYLQYCDEIGDCHIWKLGRNSIGAPIARVDGKVVNVRRFIFQLSGREIPEKHSLRTTCDEKGGIHPKHQKPVTQQELMKEMNSLGRRKPNPLKSRESAHISGWVKLSMEDARTMRSEWDGSTRWIHEAAKRWGIHVSHVRAILYHRRWKEYDAMSNQFRSLMR
jgi:hypothetical protein